MASNTDVMNSTIFNATTINLNATGGGDGNQTTLMNIVKELTNEDENKSASDSDESMEEEISEDMLKDLINEDDKNQPPLRTATENV